MALRSGSALGNTYFSTANRQLRAGLFVRPGPQPFGQNRFPAFVKVSTLTGRGSPRFARSLYFPPPRVRQRNQLRAPQTEIYVAAVKSTALAYGHYCGN